MKSRAETLGLVASRWEGEATPSGFASGVQELLLVDEVTRGDQSPGHVFGNH